MMAIHIGMIAVLLLTVSVMSTSAASAEIRCKTGFHLDRWESDAGEKGMQYHIPLEFASDMGAFSLKVLSAYVYNDVDSPGSASKSPSGMVDTRVNLAYEVIDKWPVDVLFAFDLSLPTGKTKLPAAEAISISDPDKITITRMGEGLNLNPNLSMVKQWHAWLASVGIGYLARGKYDAADTLENYDPGDALNIAAQLNYSMTDQWLLRLFGSHTRFGTDHQNGSDYFEAGNVRIIGGGVTFTKFPWELAGTCHYIQRDRNKLTDGSGALISEEHDSYGDEKIVELSGRLQINDPTSAKLWLKYMNLAGNGYPRSSNFYTSDRTKLAIGCELVRRLGMRWEAGLRLQLFDMSVDDNPTDVTDTDFSGDSIAMWIAAQF